MEETIRYLGIITAMLIGIYGAMGVVITFGLGIKALVNDVSFKTYLFVAGGLTFAALSGIWAVTTFL